jgi:molybdenum cofactor synthesis domain-containing protein
MSTRLRASVVVIGDEILGGFVQDTNSGWMARRLTALGIPLERVVTVPDELDAIDEALTGELARARPRVVLTSGGIGSTPDDLTLEAVARHLGRDLRTDPDIDARITKALAWTSGQGVTVSAGHERSMRKMARVPDGAYLLPGASGVAPGVAVDVDGGVHAGGGATVVVLPGVPSEFRRIVAEGVEPALLAGRGRPLHLLEVTHSYPESTLNPVLDRIVAEYPDVHLGSYPGAECIVRLQGPEDRTEEAAELVRDFLVELDRDDGAVRVREGWKRRWQRAGPA